MTTKTSTLGSTPGNRLVDLAVTFEGMTVAVGAGPFTWKGAEVALVDDFEVALTADAAVVTDVRGYLVKDNQEDDFTIVLDEVKRDGEDEPFDFTESARYDLVALVFRVVVVSEAESLDDADRQVYRYIERPAPSREGDGEAKMTERRLALDAARKADKKAAGRKLAEQEKATAEAAEAAEADDE